MDILRNVPLGLYLESPQTWLHRLDPRVKFVWLMSVLLSPILANNLWRLLIIVGLALLTWAALLPMRVWIRQLFWVAAVGVLTFGLVALAPDGLGVDPQPQRQTARIPAYGLVALPSDPGTTRFRAPVADPAAYRYELFNSQALGWPGPSLVVTRRSVGLSIRVSTLFFTLLYATNLFLLTTAPEEVTAALERLGQPLKRFGVPVAEIILTLALALRFLPLVMEEVQNLIRAVRTRDVRWQLLSLRGGIKTVLMVVERLLENLLLRAEQTAAAMQVRGYLGSTHPVRWHQLTLSRWDRILLLLLPLFWGIRLVYFTFIG